MRADRAELIAHYDFPLDTFQLRALDALDDGESVLVAGGAYTGQDSVASGVSLYGGYGGVADGWNVRDRSRLAELSGPSQAMVVANVFHSTVLQLLAVTAAVDDAPQCSGSSIALILAGSTGQTDMSAR